MTTHQPSPPPAIQPDPFANKAIAAAGTTIAGVITQYLATGQFTLSQEGVTAIVGGVATVLVYFITNKTRKGV